MFKLLPLIFIIAFTQASFAEDITDEKKRVIDEMLEMTGAAKIGESMGIAVSNQMIAAMSQQQQLSPEIEAVIRDEMNAIMHEQFIANGFFKEMSYEVYHKHFSTAELKEVVAFYKTPTGSKMARLLPQITEEGMLIGQRHGESLGPLIEQRMLARFKKEGIL